MTPEASPTANPRPFAVVTGGTNGIGFELAQLFLADGYDILIAGEDDAHSDEARVRLAQHGGEVMLWKGDLGNEDRVADLYKTVHATRRPVAALCVNAGFGLGGRFAETSLDAELQMIDVNVRGAVQLTKLLLPAMIEYDAGRILFTSSIAATMPDPFEAVYGGTKVFLRWFGGALRNELKDTGVTVTVLMPSMTETNFFHRADMMDTRAGQAEKDDAGAVAKAGYDALMAGRDKVIPGLGNQAMGAVADLLPDTAAAAIHRKLSEPGSATPSRRRSPGSSGLAGWLALGVGGAVAGAWWWNRSQESATERRTRERLQPRDVAARSNAADIRVG